MMKLLLKTRNCVSKTRNYVLKTRKFLLKMMNFAVIRANVGYQFILFIQMMSSVGSIVRIYEGNYVFKMTNSVSKLMNSALKMTNSASKMMANSAFQNDGSAKVTSALLETHSVLLVRRLLV